MTVTTNAPTSAPIDFVTVLVDGIEVSVPKGTLVIRAAELIGIEIPRFCDHPLLEPVAACRQCLVEIGTPDRGGVVRFMPKPQPACAITVSPGMAVRTQLTSDVARLAQEGIMEFLLINHPLDCPICDKGGECPLQNQSMSHGRSETRFDSPKRSFPKPIPVSAQILLDRERCVNCARCTRFSEQIAGDPFIELLERGSQQQVGIATGEPFESYFSGNTIQICPVGALTSTSYRFRARPFDLVSTPTACEHCASGCELRSDHRRGYVTRRLAGNDPAVNEEWSCDKGRFAFASTRGDDRITTPMIRGEDGELIPTSWSDALDVAARGLAAHRGNAAVLTGGRVTTEDAYAYAKFARVALGSNDVDFRARAHSSEEAAFLAALVAGRGVRYGDPTVTYRDLEAAPVVLLVALEPEEESPIVYLRLRKAARRARTVVASVAAYASPGLDKCGGILLQAAPGAEAAVLSALSGKQATEGPSAAVHEKLRAPGAVVLVGERAVAAPGLLSAAAALAAATGARLAWVPRRAGEHGALHAGALPGLLPGGRPANDAVARAQVGAAWGVELPTAAGRDTAGILAAAAAGSLGALVVGGVEVADLPDRSLAFAALDNVGFLVSLEVRESAVTMRADVVLPVAAVAQKDGSFTDWEGRDRRFTRVLAENNALSDTRVLHVLADAMDSPLHTPTPAAARAELARLGAWGGARADVPAVTAPAVAQPGRGQAVLASHRMLLDLGRGQDGEPHLAATARRPVVRLSATTAAELGAAVGSTITVSTPGGQVSLPVEITSMPDRTVWIPANSPGSRLTDLEVGVGAVVGLSLGGTR